MTNVVAVLFGESGVDRSALGTLGAGQKLAAQGGGSLIAVVLGPLVGGSDSLSGVVDRVVVADQPELEKYQPDVALGGELLTGTESAESRAIDAVFSKEDCCYVRHSLDLLGASELTDCAGHSGDPVGKSADPLIEIVSFDELALDVFGRNEELHDLIVGVAGFDLIAVQPEVA